MQENPICNILPMSLTDIVCIDINAHALCDLGEDRFEDQLNDFEAQIAKGLYQTELYVKAKPELALQAIRAHNKTVLEIRSEILNEEMIRDVRVCLTCNRLFWPEYYNQGDCFGCGGGEV